MKKIFRCLPILFFFPLLTDTPLRGQEASLVLLRANLHVHTDGNKPTDHFSAQSPADTFLTARALGYQCIGLTDHGGHLNQAEWDDRFAASRAATSGGFIGLRGFEWTKNYGGIGGVNLPGERFDHFKIGARFDHINIFGTQSWTDAEGAEGFGGDGEPPSLTTTVGGLYSWLRSAMAVGDHEQIVGQFNHVAKCPDQPFATDGVAFKYDPAADEIIDLLELAITDTPIPNDAVPITGESRFQDALNKGWHVGPTLGADNSGVLTTRSHTGIWVESGKVTQAGVVAALRKRRVFATESPRLSLMFKANGQTMGDMDVPVTSGMIQLAVEAYEFDRRTIQKIEFVTNRGVFRPFAFFSTASVVQTVAFNNIAGLEWGYLRLTINDLFIRTRRAYSAPIWFRQSSRTTLAGSQFVQGTVCQIEVEKAEGATCTLSIREKTSDRVIATAGITGTKLLYLASKVGPFVVKISNPALRFARTNGNQRNEPIANPKLRIRGQAGVTTSDVEFEVIAGSTFPPGRRANDPNDILEMTDAYNAVGGELTMGRALGPVFQGANAGASNVQCELQEFPNGNIYRWKTSGARPANSAYVIKGSIYATWYVQGRQTGTLGMPVSNEQPAQGSPTGVVATQQDFEGGRILALPDRPQAYFVVGAIDAAWARSGRQTGPLGLPISEEYAAATSPTGVTSKIQEFERGFIYKHTSGGLSEQAFAVVDAFASKYFSMGRSTSLLGLPMDDERDEAQSIAGTGVKKQQFERGFLFKHTSGALNGQVFAISEAILQKWLGLGGTTGRLGAPSLGAPKSDRQVVENGTGTASGFVQEFETGGVIVTIGTEPTSPTYAVFDTMYARWGAEQRELGPLGFPIEDEREESQSINGTALNVQRFEGGQLLRHRSGARNGQVFAVVGPFQQKWAVDLAGSTGPLGAPIEDERNESQSIKGTGLRVQKFESGQLLKHTTGALNGQVFAVRGALLRKWAVDLAGTTGILGAPIKDIEPVANGRITRSGFLQEFEDGTLAMTGGDPNVGTPFAVARKIYERWFASGRHTSELGFPTDDVQTLNNGRITSNGFLQPFEGGNVTLVGSNPSQGTAFAVTSRIYDRWFGMGRQTGDLGFPTSERIVVTNGRITPNGFIQEFEGGNVALAGTDASQGTARQVVGAVFSRWFALGRQTGDFGFPTADATVESGIKRQQFEGGLLTSSSVIISRGVGTVALPTTGSFTRADLGLQDVRLAAWDAANQRYTFDDEIGSLRAGAGYWFKASGVRTAQPSGSEVTGSFNVALNGRGWNFVSSPYQVSLPWDSQLIKIRRGTEEKTLAQAYDAIWLENCAWYWEPNLNNPETGNYVPVCDGGAIPNAVNRLPALRGFWVFAYVDCELVLPQPANVNASRALLRRRPSIHEWLVSLSAQTGDSTDLVYFGSAPSERQGQSLRFAKPPAAPIDTGIEIAIVSSDTKRPLGADLRANLAPRDGWQFVVRASWTHSDVTLRWDNLARAPRPLRFHLIDETTGARRYMRTTAGYTFRTGASAEERRFRVEVVSSPAPDKLVSRLDILSSSALTGARFSLMLSRSAIVDARIVTSSGKVAAVIARNVQGTTGANALAWNGKNSLGLTLPRGAYLVEVTATDDEGQQVKIVRSTVLR